MLHTNMLFIEVSQRDVISHIIHQQNIIQGFLLYSDSLTRLGGNANVEKNLQGKSHSIPISFTIYSTISQKEMKVEICTVGRIHIVHIAPDLILYNMNNHLILSLGTHCWYPSSKKRGVIYFLQLIFFLPPRKVWHISRIKIQTSISNHAWDTWLRIVQLLIMGTGWIRQQYLKTKS